MRRRNAGIKADWGPTAYCSQLEGSKTFAKEFMAQNNIPTAAYEGFTDAPAAKAYVDEQKVRRLSSKPMDSLLVKASSLQKTSNKRMQQSTTCWLTTSSATLVAAW